MRLPVETVALLHVEESNFDDSTVLRELHVLPYVSGGDLIILNWRKGKLYG